MPSHVLHLYKKEKMRLKGWLRLGALAAIPEALSSILSTHMAVCNSMCQGIQHLLLVSKDTHQACTWCKDIHEGRTPIHTQKNLKSKKSFSKKEKEEEEREAEAMATCIYHSLLPDYGWNITNYLKLLIPRLPCMMNQNESLLPYAFVSYSVVPKQLIEKPSSALLSHLQSIREPWKFRLQDISSPNPNPSTHSYFFHPGPTLRLSPGLLKVASSQISQISPVST